MIYAIFLIPCIIAIFLAINMGASGITASFAATYGANLIRKGLLSVAFGIFVLLGALIAGGKVMSTIGGEVVPSMQMNWLTVSIILLSSAISIFFANLLRVPQSTSQSTVGALVGVAFYLNSLNPSKLLLEIVPAWFVLPIISIGITYFASACLRKSTILAGVIRIVALSKYPVYKFLAIACSCYLAFSIGANNVANAAGPLASMMMNEQNLLQGDSATLPIVLLSTLFVAPWFGIGGSMLGKEVIETTGRKITDIGPVGAAFINFVTATLLLLASVTRGLPISLVQLSISSMIALGISKVGVKQILTQSSVIRLLTIWITAPLISLVIAFSLMVVTVGWSFNRL